MSGFWPPVNNCDVCGKTSPWNLTTCPPCDAQREEKIHQEVIRIRATNKCCYCEIPLTDNNWVVSKTSNAVPMCVTCSRKGLHGVVGGGRNNGQQWM